MAKLVAQKVLFGGSGHLSCLDSLGKSTLSIAVHRTDNPGRYAAHYGVGWYVAGHDRTSCYDDVVADRCAWEKNGIHANEDIITDHNWRNHINTRTFLPKYPDRAIMSNETHAESQFYMIANRNEVRFCTKSSAINSAKFAIAANHHAYSACIPDGVIFDLPVVPGPCGYPVYSVHHRYADLPDTLDIHQLMMVPENSFGNSPENGAVDE